MTSIITVENLSKKYIIGHQRQERYTALRDVLANGVKRTVGKLLHPRAKRDDPEHEEFWALKDISFDIKQGDRVGIIGRNGAGKSTLLKVLSRITEPTSERVKIKGRVASLLEVGTGFHPELTGRENVFLNGAILGMSKAEIKSKFDEIVAFSEVEKFLDTPVKRYSSGMYVRLAFAVAAHLEPEILIVDEVLAVGDAQFQKKCLGKMQDVGTEGRTVLFVSHNMGAVQALCTKGVVLKEGKVAICESIEKAVRYYTGIQLVSHSSYVASHKSDKPYFLKIEVTQENNEGDIFRIDKPITIRFDIETLGKKNLVVGLVIRNNQDMWIHHSSDEFKGDKIYSSDSLREAVLPPYALAAGRYCVDAHLDQRNVESFERITDKIVFDVDFSGEMSAWTTGSDWKGLCGPGLVSWH